MIVKTTAERLIFTFDGTTITKTNVKFKITENVNCIYPGNTNKYICPIPHSYNSPFINFLR